MSDCLFSVAANEKLEVFPVRCAITRVVYALHTSQLQKYLSFSFFGVKSNLLVVHKAQNK